MLRLLIAFFSGVTLSAVPFELSMPVIEESRKIFVREWEDPSAALLNSDRSELEFPAVVEVPGEAPSYLLLRAETNHPVRLIVHLETAKLPTQLLEKAPEKDWSNPNKRYDLRCIIELDPKANRSVGVDLGSDFFESITKQRSQFDLSGQKVEKIAIELVKPVSAGQYVQLHRVQIVTLTAEAMRSGRAMQPTNNWRSSFGSTPLPSLVLAAFVPKAI